MSRPVTMGVGALIVAAALSGCAASYSPNTYSASAVQQANKVEPGVVVGFRQVRISVNGTVGAVTGGAAGGVLGAQVGGPGITAALGTVGGTAIGGLLGNTIERATGDTFGWEYIIRKPNGELLSLTQQEEAPIPINQKVLVITGSQARIVPDYSTPPDPPPPPPSPPQPPAPTRIEIRELPAPAAEAQAPLSPDP